MNQRIEDDNVLAGVEIPTGTEAIRPTRRLHIGWRPMAVRLVRRRRFVMTVTAVWAVLGVAVVLCGRRRYEVTKVLSPEIQTRSTSGLSSLATMMMRNPALLYSGTDAINVTLFPELVKTTPFVREAFAVELTGGLTRRQQLRGVEPLHTTVYDHLAELDREPSWFSLAIGAVARLLSPADDDVAVASDAGSATGERPFTRRDLVVAKRLMRHIAVATDRKTNLVTITVRMDDPLMAMQLADSVCAILQRRLTAYRTGKAHDDYLNYAAMAHEAEADLVEAQRRYAEYIDSNKSLANQAVSNERDRLSNNVSLARQTYSTMVSQRDNAKAREQEMKPAFAVIEPGYVPVRPADSRRRKVVAFTVVGFLLACGWVLVGEGAWRRVSAAGRDVWREGHRPERSED